MTSLICALVLPSIVGFRQEKVTDIPKIELPKKANCVVCSANGEDHGEERPIGGVRYKDKTFFFCNPGEIKKFKANPEHFMPPVLPRPMPELSFTDTSGAIWNKETLKGKVLLLDYWATWCGPCAEVKPVVDRIAKKYSDQGVVVLSVSIDKKRADLDRFLKKNTFASRVVHDVDSSWSKMPVRVVPTLFLVKDGQIIWQKSGLAKQDVLEKEISGALGK